VPSTRLQHDRETILACWGDALLHFDSRVRTLQLWSRDVRIASSRLELDWCIACLADIRAALYRLHVRIVEEGLSVEPHGPAIVSYLSEAYVWCGDVLDNVQALVCELRGGPAVRDAGLADDSSEYIDEFLSPLFQSVCESCRLAGDGDRSTLVLLPHIERLHVAIVSLNWALERAQMPFRGPDSEPT